MLIDPEDVEQIASALRRLVDDPALRERMGSESRAIDAASEGRDVAAFESAIAAQR
jgi:glycosyltransferase involved in cell wall biosynthesis